MLALVRPEPSEDAMAADYDTDAAPIVLPIPAERHGYAPPPGRRVLAFVGTSCIYALVAVGLFLSFEVSSPPPKPAAPLVVTLLPLASPPETPPKPKEAPKPIEKQDKKPTPPKVEPIMRTIAPVATLPAPQAQPIAPPAPTPPQPETAAPRTAPASPAPQASSNAPDTWEGRVLARLEKYRRYPGDARSARQQGVVYTASDQDQLFSADTANVSSRQKLSLELIEVDDRQRALFSAVQLEPWLT
ncbi:hypothetical protein [Sphingobium cloacae]|uniref:Uncharacterized protein n=1 Tax=Sphingobium cloacae TaxID=120107 RepID=A0A1E1F0B2_9SPHN|nr:hypothetical protein [Sphingobium cloacae]BAV63934.1 hypothetical protein SCLO_1008940 [Sphingobium cloacae]